MPRQQPASPGRTPGPPPRSTPAPSGVAAGPPRRAVRRNRRRPGHRRRPRPELRQPGRPPLPNRSTAHRMTAQARAEVPAAQERAQAGPAEGPARRDAGNHRSPGCCAHPRAGPLLRLRDWPVRRGGDRDRAAAGDRPAGGDPGAGHRAPDRLPPLRLRRDHHCGGAGRGECAGPVRAPAVRGVRLSVARAVPVPRPHPRGDRRPVRRHHLARREAP